MSHALSSSSFWSPLNSALRFYATQTGTQLNDHSLYKQLENCDSAESISSVLQEHARGFPEFGEDGKIIKSLKSVVHVLYELSTITALGEGINIPFPLVRAVYSAFGILLAAQKDVGTSYDPLVDLFQSIASFLNRLDIYTKTPLTTSMTNIVIKLLVEVLSTLAIVTKQVKQGRLEKFKKKTLGENEIEAILQRLDRLTQDEARATGVQTLEVLCSLVRHRRTIMEDLDDQAYADNTRKALEIMEQIANQINKPKRDELQDNFRKWLSSPDPWINHNVARKSQHNGTGEWLIRNDTLCDWKNYGPNSLLCIYGKPGAGKTVLSSSIIENIHGMCTMGLASLAFFYCDFRDNRKECLRGLLSALLVQLCGHSDAFYDVFSDFYSANDRGYRKASDSELLQCLKNILELPKRPLVYIIIDALDECPITADTPSRNEVLSLVEELVASRFPNLRICVTSQPEADIAPVLNSLDTRSIVIHGEPGHIQDIAEYIKFVVNADYEMRRWRTSDKELVINALTEKANGIFQWVYYQLVYLRCCLPGRLRYALDELPNTLDQTYERMLQDIGNHNWECAHRIFQCVAAASRPLRADELAEILAFDFNAESTPTFVIDWRSKDPVHAILSTCSNLLAVADVDGSPVIHFSHFSAKGYLTSNRLAEAKDSISRFHVSMTPANTVVAQACLGVLLYLDENITEDSLKEFPLAMYAAEHWVGHARFNDVSPNIQDGMKRFFGPGNHHLSVWVWIYDPDPWPGHSRIEHPSQMTGTPMHYAAICGLTDIVKFLIIKCSQHVNTLGFHLKETPLASASRRGYSEVACVLLEYGADMEIRDRRGWSPLDCASGWGHADVIRVLVEHGADVKALRHHNTTALHIASHNRCLASVQMLLKYGADANAKNDTNETPLHSASDEEIARVLITYGADPNVQDTYNRTPLSRALGWRGSVKLAHVLLENGADIKFRDETFSLLHLACEEGYVDGVRLLLQRCLDIHERDDEGQTPFQVASVNGHEKVMKLLLEHGAMDHKTP